MMLPLFYVGKLRLSHFFGAKLIQHVYHRFQGSSMLEFGNLLESIR
jgi:hypothetical protein